MPYFGRFIDIYITCPYYPYGEKSHVIYLDVCVLTYTYIL